MLATLSRWRSRVQIPSGTLEWHGTPTGRAAKFKPWCLWVRIPPVLLGTTHASAGHWRAQVAVTHPPSGFGGSTPSRRTYSTARSSSGRMRDPHSRGMGSIPIRVTDIAKWRNKVDARHSDRRAREGVRVRLSPWLLDETMQVRQVPSWAS